MKLRDADESVDQMMRDADQLTGVINDRSYWADTMLELQKVLQRTEEAVKGRVGVDVGIWIETFQPVVPGSAGYAVSTGDEEVGDRPETEAEKLTRRTYNLPPPGPRAERGKGPELDTIKLVCRAVNVARPSPGANTERA